MRFLRWLLAIVISLGLVLCGGTVALRVGTGGRFAFGRRGWSMALAGGLLIVSSFVWRGEEAARGEMPGPFPWPIFLAGMALGLWAFARAWRRGSGAE